MPPPAINHGTNYIINHLTKEVKLNEVLYGWHSCHQPSSSKNSLGITSDTHHPQHVNYLNHLKLKT